VHAHHDFKVNIPLVAAAVSKHLQETGRLISSLASANSSTPGDITTLAAQTTSLQESISTQSTSISLTRIRVTELSTSLHNTYTSLFETSIRILEQVHHGSISRGFRARAEHFAVVAKGLELKLQILAQTDSALTDPGLQTELERYRERLEGKAEELSGRVGVSERALGEYGRAGKGMAEIARRFAEVRGECEGVREEIERLEARRSDVD
jgi:chromosome segregation ATPase